jgi:hypothetical protein
LLVGYIRLHILKCKPHSETCIESHTYVIITCRHNLAGTLQQAECCIFLLLCWRFSIIFDRTLHSSSPTPVQNGVITVHNLALCHQCNFQISLVFSLVVNWTVEDTIPCLETTDSWIGQKFRLELFKVCDGCSILGICNKNNLAEWKDSAMFEININFIRYRPIKLQSQEWLSCNKRRLAVPTKDWSAVHHCRNL